MFPNEPLGARTELRIDGSWVNITSDVYTRDALSITRGRADEGTRADPAQLRVTIDTRDGRYSPRNPRSPLYGKIGRNTAVRVTLPGAGMHLAMDGAPGSHASTPDTAALNITGDLDLRVDCELEWTAAGNQNILGKWDSDSGAARSYMLTLSSGLLYLYWSTIGTGSGYMSWLLPADMPRRAVLRATLTVDDTAGVKTGQAYWGTAVDGPWDWTSEPVPVSNTGPLFTGSAPLEIGPYNAAAPTYRPVAGRIYRAQVRAGVDGTPVCDVDFEAQAAGATAFTDSTGLPWTLAGGAELTERFTLGMFEVASWPPRWDVTGRDVYTPIEAAGILRRLGQGRKALESTLRRRLPSQPDLVAYWPLEEGADAERAYSPVFGVYPMTVTGVEWAADSTLPGSSPLPKVGQSGASFRAPVPSAPSGAWHAEMVYNLAQLPTSGELTLLEILTTNRPWARLRVTVTPTTIRCYGIDDNSDSSSTTLLFNFTAPGFFVAGQWNRLQLKCQQSGSGYELNLGWIAIGETISKGDSTTVSSATCGRVTRIDTSTGAAAAGMPVGHISVWSVYDTLAYNFADKGFRDEDAVSRLYRLTTEEDGLPLTVVDGDLTSNNSLMGPQLPTALLDLVTECADVDGGILYEDHERLALVYRDRTTLYNQAPRLILDYREGEIAPPLEPVEDDQGIRNDITVTRSRGSSGRVVIDEGPLSVLPPEQGGVGIYDEAVTLNLANDAQTTPAAAWLAYLGTWDEARYPTVRIMLHKAPHLIPDLLRMREGDLVRLTGLPDWLPPGDVDLIVRGMRHTLGVYTWTVDLNCTAGGPYNLATVEDEQYARVDTDGCTLSGAISATTQVVNVHTQTGSAPWITMDEHPEDFPFLIRVGGEVMRVLTCAGAESQALFVERSVNGVATAHAAGTDVRLATPAYVAY